MTLLKVIESHIYDYCDIKFTKEYQHTLRVSGSIESMSPKTDFTMKIPYLDYCDSRGVIHFLVGPTVQKLPSGHENTV